jgi:hypothetical protein
MAKSAELLEPTISTTELCERRYHCDARTLRRRAKEAGVRGMKPGRERVYKLSEVEEIDRVVAERSGELPRRGQAPQFEPSEPPPRDASAALAKVRAQRHRALGRRLLASRDKKVVVLDFAR